ncbi:MAG: response regulator [Leptolyngbyaceae cyanobacterium]
MDKAQPKHILAVDDSPDNLFLIETILDLDEYQLSFAKSGEAAIAQIGDHPPDLLLLDIMMPGMDGYEVTRRVRGAAELPYVPILLLTAHDHVSLVEGLDAGADDFIRKPFDIDELQARVRSLLRMREAMDGQAYMLRQRDDFVARLTHDLRTPLVAANRMLSFCKNESFGPVADGAKEALTETMQNNEQLLSMVNTLLEVYRHDSGHKSLTIIPLNLYDIAAAVVSELKPLAAEKNLTLKLSDRQGTTITDTAPYEMLGDVMELRRVLTNLIGNALKFTDEGHILVQLDHSEQPPPNLTGVGGQRAKSWLSVQVIDTGIGISESEEAEIFAWFRQGTQRRAGSGLGLHLAGRIAQMHQGFIDVSSQPRQGSTFTLFLPVQKPVMK